MKKSLSILFVLVFIVISAFSAFAAEENGVSFITEDINCSKGRLFSVDVKASSADKLSAVIFTFTYDRNLMEYRSVSTASDSMVYAYDNGKTLNVSYLCADGKEINKDTVIFTLKFKAVSAGKTDLSYTAEDCVSPSAQSIPIYKCTNGAVTVGADSVDVNDAQNSDSSGNDNRDLPDENNAADNNTSECTTDEIGFLNGRFEDNGAYMLAVGMLCGTAVALLFFMIYFIISRIKGKENSGKKEN